MEISSVSLKNWRNFQKADAALGDVTYVIGANATGKSNFLDVFRFLRDIAKPNGGGLQKAISDRLGLSKMRCLHARRDPEISIEVQFVENKGDETPLWTYRLAIKSEGAGANRPVVGKEEVFHNVKGKMIPVLERPNDIDKEDKERLTETALEQVQSNKKFREIAEFFSDMTYLHLVPQLLKYGEFIGGRQLESDPFGQAFLERVAKTPEKTRSSRLTRINNALAKAIPQFEGLHFVKDDAGRPHLEMKYLHHRPGAGLQREDQFSDGTLRLIALFWMLMDGNSLLLLEEPELSLDEDIVRSLPRLIAKVRKSSKKAGRQIIVSTHSQALLEEKAIDGRSVLRLEREGEGTKIVAPTESELLLLESGLSAADVLLPKVHPKDAIRMALS